MPMGKWEIIESFKNSKTPWKQVRILAELNDCSNDEIKKILIEAGVPEETFVYHKNGDKGCCKKSHERKLAREAEKAVAAEDTADEITVPELDDGLEEVPVPKAFDAVAYLRTRIATLNLEIDEIEKQREHLLFALRELEKAGAENG